MSEFNSRDYPERRPNLNNFDRTPASELTVATLVSLAEEYAVKGGVQHDRFRPRIFQNHTTLEDGRSLYVTRYYTAAGEEMPVGQKVGDILIQDPVEAMVYGKPDANKINDYTDYYFVNEGDNRSGGQTYRAEKHRLQCRLRDLRTVVGSNEKTNNPNYMFEKGLGFRTVSEGEAIEFVRLFAGKL
jgi:hypothetical protein